jgi:RND family efflux transporter MFP subunit
MWVLWTFGALACGGEAREGKKTAEHSTVRAAVVQEVAFAQPLEVPGTIEAWRSAVLAPAAQGRITDVRVRIGDPVEKGDLLLKIEDAAYRQGVTQAAAGLRLAEAQARQAQAELNRLKELKRSQNVADAQIEQAQVAAEITEAQEAQAKAGLEAARQRLSDTRLVAPFDGVIIARNVSPGEMAGGEARLPPIMVADLSKLRVVAAISELDVGTVAAGQTAQVRVDAFPEKSFEAVVERVNAALDPITRSVQVEAVLSASPGLKHGMSCTLVVDRPAVQSPAVPRSALVGRTNGHARVWVLDGNVVRGRSVIYRTSREDSVPVLSGLQVGETVVSAGHERLREGEVVTIAQGEGP